MCRVGDGAHGGCATLVVDVSDGLCAYIQHQSIDQLDVVAISWLIRHLMEKIKQQLIVFVFNNQLKNYNMPHV